MISTSYKITCVLLVLVILLGACNSSHRAYKKRRKPAPCDCPKFNQVPDYDTYRTYVMNVTGFTNIINA